MIDVADRDALLPVRAEKLMTQKLLVFSCGCWEVAGDCTRARKLLWKTQFFEFYYVCCSRSFYSILSPLSLLLFLCICSFSLYSNPGDVNAAIGLQL